MIWVGLTGGIASGKSTVAKFLEQKGIPVIYADRIANEIYEKNSSELKNILNLLGKSILNTDGTVNKSKVGEIVFKDRNILNSLENIIHPYVRRRVAEEKEKFLKQGCALAVYEVPLLFEKKMQDQFDCTLLIYTSENEQIKRVMKRNNLTLEQATSRIEKQMRTDEKIKLANHNIENSSSELDLKNKIDSWLKAIKEKYSLPRL